MNKEEMVLKIIEAKESYYAGTPIMSDLEFDSLEESLKKIDPCNSILSKVGAKVKKGKIKHVFPMISQEKALSNKDLFSWISKIKSVESRVVASDKMDGMSCSIHYLNGAFTKAVSRGDGEFGQDISAKVIKLDFPKFIEDFSGEVRGELVLSISNFESINKILKVPFSNPRNAVVGIINEDILDLEKVKLLSFVAFDLILSSSHEVELDFTPSMDFLIEEGFKVVSFSEFSLLETDYEGHITEVLESKVENRDLAEFLVDGVVFRVASIEVYKSLGSTAHHSKGSIAWKYPSKFSEVVVEDIEWSTGTKDITPVAIFKSVLIDGALVGRVSLKSLKNMIGLGIGLGTTVRVHRSGGVIPWAEMAVANKKTKEEITEAPYVPDHCPSCNSAVSFSQDFAHLFCISDSCEGKFSRKLEIFAKALDMDYFGQKNCEKLATKISKFHQLFEMSMDDIVACGIGNGVAEHLKTNIFKSKEFELSKFLTSLGISKCGPSTSKLLAKEYKSLDKILSLAVIDLVSDFDRVAEASATILIRGIAGAKEEINNLLKHILIIDTTKGVETSAIFKDTNICITGPLSIDRKKWKEKIEEFGGKFHSGVTKNTNILICNKKSSSSKYQKAVKLNIPIFKEVWLFDKLSDV